MEELDLKELFSIFWSKKTQILLIVLIFMVIGIIYTIGFITPVYSASATFLLVSSGNTGGGSTNSTITTTDLTLNSKLVSTYSELIRSKSVLGTVISNLGIDKSYESLKNNVSVNSVKDTDVISITVKDENATYAAKIANETVKVFAEQVKDKFYNIENVQAVDQAEVDNEPSNINHPKDVIIFMFIGLVIAIIYVLVLNMLDTTVKTPEDIEKLFSTLPVLVAMPMYDMPQDQKSKAKGGRR